MLVSDTWRHRVLGRVVCNVGDFSSAFGFNVCFGWTRLPQVHRVTSSHTYSSSKFAAQYLYNFLYIFFRGYLGPGGLHDGGGTFNCSGGAAGYIDRTFFGGNHLYNWNVIKVCKNSNNHRYVYVYVYIFLWFCPNFQIVYGAEQNHDPEGILGSLTSIFICFLGLQAGKIIVAFKSPSARCVRFMVWAVINVSKLRYMSIQKFYSSLTMAVYMYKYSF